MLTNINPFNTKNNYPPLTQNASFGRMMRLEEALKLKDAFLSGDTFVVSPHRAPDEDTTALFKVVAHWLEKQGKKVIICADKHELNGLNIKPSKYNIKKKIKEIPDKLVVLDFSGTDKTPKMLFKLLEKINPKKIVGLDHHVKTDNFLKGDIYVDDTAKACSEIGYQFFKLIGEKLSKEDLKSLYCGMLSDFQKSKLLRFKNGKLIKLPALNDFTDSKKILEEVEAQIDIEAKEKIWKHLDILSNLTEAEKAFRKRLFSEVKVTSNGKLAYVIIDAKDDQWKKLGGHTTRNSAILRDIRTRLINGVQDDKHFTDEQKKLFNNLQAAIIFYRAGDDYQMSIHSKNNYAQKLNDYINNNLIKDKSFEESGGHPNRSGGRVHSLKQKDIDNFINKFWIANQNIN